MNFSSVFDYVIIQILALVTDEEPPYRYNAHFLALHQDNTL